VKDPINIPIGFNQLQGKNKTNFVWQFHCVSRAECRSIEW